MKKQQIRRKEKVIAITSSSIKHTGGGCFAYY
jgi:hypothetical protein